MLGKETIGSVWMEVNAGRRDQGGAEKEEGISYQPASCPASRPREMRGLFADLPKLRRVKGVLRGRRPKLLAFLGLCIFPAWLPPPTYLPSAGLRPCDSLAVIGEAGWRDRFHRWTV